MRENLQGVIASIEHIEDYLLSKDGVSYYSVLMSSKEVNAPSSSENRIENILRQLMILKREAYSLRDTDQEKFIDNYLNLKYSKDYIEVIKDIDAQSRTLKPRI